MANTTATTADWGLTDAGFRRPTYAELLDALEYKARELFGQSANLSVRSPLGIFLRIFAWVFNILWSVLEDVYNSRFVDTAVGSSLYQIGRFIGLRLLGAQKAMGYLTFYGTDGQVAPSGYLAETTAGKRYITLAEGVITEGEVTLPASSVDTGPDGNTDAGTVRIVTNPKLGITGVTNLNAFEGGRDTETDEEYRERYYKSVDFAGGVNIDAIVAEVLASVEGIVSAVGEENDTDFENANGLPPHSFEIIAFGGLDEDVAQAIYRRKAGGIQTYGNTTVPVVEADGGIYELRFSRPTPVKVWVKVFNLTVDKNFPLDGIEQIKERIAEYIGVNTKGGLSIGQSVITVALPTEVFKVTGVVDFDLQISSDGENFSWKNITVASREKAVTEESAVIVE